MWRLNVQSRPPRISFQFRVPSATHAVVMAFIRVESTLNLGCQGTYIILLAEHLLAVLPP